MKNLYDTASCLKMPFAELPNNTKTYSQPLSGKLPYLSARWQRFANLVVQTYSHLLFCTHKQDGKKLISEHQKWQVGKAANYLFYWSQPP